MRVMNIITRYNLADGQALHLQVQTISLVCAAVSNQACGRVGLHLK